LQLWLLKLAIPLALPWLTQANKISFGGIIQWITQRKYLKDAYFTLEVSALDL
jgi:hypothetical protein